LKNNQSSTGSGFERLAVLAVDGGANKFGLIFDVRTRKITKAPPVAQRSVGRSIDQTIAWYKSEHAAAVESIGPLPGIPLHLIERMIQREIVEHLTLQNFCALGPEGVTPEDFDDTPVAPV
jgi:hypothetical protein